MARVKNTQLKHRLGKMKSVLPSSKGPAKILCISRMNSMMSSVTSR